MWQLKTRNTTSTGVPRVHEYHEYMSTMSTGVPRVPIVPQVQEYHKYHEYRSTTSTMSTRCTRCTRCTKKTKTKSANQRQNYCNLEYIGLIQTMTFLNATVKICNILYDMLVQIFSLKYVFFFLFCCKTCKLAPAKCFFFYLNKH